MVRFFTASIRALLVSAVLALAVQPVEAAREGNAPATNSRTDTPQPADSEDQSLDGWFIIAGVVGVVVLIAWIASRIGDNRSHVID